MRIAEKIFCPARRKAQEYWAVFHVVWIAPVNTPVNILSIFNAVGRKINRQDVYRDLISDSLDKDIIQHNIQQAYIDSRDPEHAGYIKDIDIFQEWDDENRNSENKYEATIGIGFDKSWTIIKIERRRHT